MKVVSISSNGNEDKKFTSILNAIFSVDYFKIFIMREDLTMR